MLALSSVTLLGIDCINVSHLLRAFQICEQYATFGAKKLLTSLQPPATTATGIEILPIAPIVSREDYSAFMIKQLDQYVSTEFVLIIQHDGFMLNPAAWTEEFLQYDYIGAPWWYEDVYNVGNGGFSLRSKRLLQLLARDSHITELHPEDHHICRTYGKYLQRQGIRFAPEEVAKNFSIEGNLQAPSRPLKYGYTWHGEFGAHGIGWKTDVSHWEGYEAFKPYLPVQRE